MRRRPRGACRSLTPAQRKRPPDGARRALRCKELADSYDRSISTMRRVTLARMTGTESGLVPGLAFTRKPRVGRTITVTAVPHPLIASATGNPPTIVGRLVNRTRWAVPTAIRLLRQRLIFPPFVAHLDLNRRSTKGFPFVRCGRTATQGVKRPGAQVLKTGRKARSCFGNDLNRPELTNGPFL